MGIDIEDTINENRVNNIKRLFTGNEVNYPQFYTQFWTLKESYLKRAGAGFSSGPAVPVDFSRYMHNESFCVQENYFFSKQFDNFWLSVCAAAPFIPELLETGIESAAGYNPVGMSINSV